MGLTSVNSGQFLVPYVSRGLHEYSIGLRVVVSAEARWDHVSVSTPARCPTWEEMEFVRELFFADDETVMQLSVPRDRHVNDHPYVLHMGRPQTPEEWYPGVCAYAADRLKYSERDRAELDEVYLACPPQAIPLPPSLMVGPSRRPGT